MIAKPTVFIFFLSLSISTVLSTASAAQTDASPDGPRVVLNWKTTDDRTVTSENVDGKLLVVSFWSTWCAHCRAALPQFKQIDDELGEQGVAIVGVSYDQKSSELHKAVAKHRLSWPQVLAKQQAGGLKGVKKRWGVETVPYAVIISPDSRIIWKGHPDDLDQPLQQAVKQHRRQMQPGRLSDRLEAIDLLVKIGKLNDQPDQHKQLVKLIAQLPAESFRDSKVIDLAAAVLKKLDPRARKMIDDDKDAKQKLELLSEAIKKKSEG